MNEAFIADLELAKKQVDLLEALEKQLQLPDFTSPEELVMLWTMHINSIEKPIYAHAKPLNTNETIALDCLLRAIQDNDGQAVHIDTLRFYVFEPWKGDKNRWRKFKSAINSLKKRSLIMQEGNFLMGVDLC